MHAHARDLASRSSSPPGRGRFTLHLEDRRLLDFDVRLKSTVWKSADQTVELHYTVTDADAQYGSGVMELVIPADRLPKEGPVRLRVTGSANQSQRYFGLLEQAGK